MIVECHYDLARLRQRAFIFLLRFFRFHAFIISRCPAEVFTARQIRHRRRFFADEGFRRLFYRPA